MARKKFPQPPFKKFVKTENGAILETNEVKHSIKPATYSNKTGRPLFQYGWTISYPGEIIGISCVVTIEDKIIATADTKEELL